jgi:hypothetical protein
MWCNKCQQETPGVAHATSGRFVCSRCQQPMQKNKPPHATRICDDGLALDEPTTAATAVSARTRFRIDDWSARQRVRTVFRELRRPNPTITNFPNRIVSDRLRFDPPHDLFAQLEHATAPGMAAAQMLPSTNPILQNRRSEGSQIVAWLIVIIGVLALGFGLGLIAWSLSHNQMLYWNQALGLAIGGQGMLILGLVLVISRLWRSTRYAATKLQEVHTRLGQLQQASEALAATRPGGAPAFYADLVRGASPHVLLANLKGQVDQLATRVGTGW